MMFWGKSSIIIFNYKKLKHKRPPRIKNYIRAPITDPFTASIERFNTRCLQDHQHYNSRASKAYRKKLVIFTKNGGTRLRCSDDKSRLRWTGTHIHQEKTWTDQDTPDLTHWSHRWQTGHTIMEERQGVAAFEQVKMIAQSSGFYVLTSVISLIFDC